MWMTDYVRAVKRGLRDLYGFKPVEGSTEQEPTFAVGAVPDGDYPMTIDGQLDKVQVVNGKFRLCRFD